MPNEYNPDYSVHPGSILEELCIYVGVKDISSTTGIEREVLQRIVEQKADIDDELAEKLALFGPYSAELWKNLQKQWNERR